MALEARARSQIPEDEAQERLDPTVVEIRFADLRRGRDAEEMAQLYVQDSAIEHLGPIRDLSLGVDYTAEDVRTYFRTTGVQPIVAVNTEGKVIGTIAVQGGDVRIPVARLQMWTVDRRVEGEGPGVGLQLLKKAEAFIFAPREPEDQGGLGLEHTEAGVIVGIGGDWTPRPVRILRAEHFVSHEMVPNRAVSWDLRKKSWDLHRTVEQFRLPKEIYLQLNRRNMMLSDVAQLRGEQPFTPFIPPRR